MIHMIQELFEQTLRPARIRLLDGFYLRNQRIKGSRSEGVTLHEVAGNPLEICLAPKHREGRFPPGDRSPAQEDEKDPGG
jgi:hypothetical protein